MRNYSSWIKLGLINVVCTGLFVFFMLNVSGLLNAAYASFAANLIPLYGIKITGLMIEVINAAYSILCPLITKRHLKKEFVGEKTKSWTANLGSFLLLVFINWLMKRFILLLLSWIQNQFVVFLIWILLVWIIFIFIPSIFDNWDNHR